MRLLRLGEKGGFGRSVAVLASGTAAAQLIAFVVAPFLTRLYTPEDFGVLAVFSGLLTYLTSVSALCYEKAILIEREDDDAYQVLALALLTVALMSIVVAAIAATFGRALLHLFDTTDLSRHIWVLPACVLLAGSNLVLSVWATRKKAFAALSTSRISQGIIRAGLQLGLGFSGLGAAGLVFGDAAGRAGGSTALVRATLAGKPHTLSRPAIVDKAKRYRNFPLISTWSTLLHQAGTSLPPLLFAAYYSKEVAGFYNLGQMAVWLPMAMIAGAISSVFSAKFAETYLQDRTKCLGLFDSTARRLALIGLAPVAIIIVGGPSIFSLLFGPKWVEAGVFIQLIALTQWVQFVSGPLFPVLNILEKQRWALFADSIGFVAILAAIAGSATSGWDARTAVTLFGVGAIILYGLLFLFARHAVKVVCR